MGTLPDCVLRKPAPTVVSSTAEPVKLRIPSSPLSLTCSARSRALPRQGQRIEGAHLNHLPGLGSWPNARKQIKMITNTFPAELEWLAPSTSPNDAILRLDWLCDEVLDGVLFEARLGANSQQSDRLQHRQVGIGFLADSATWSIFWRACSFGVGMGASPVKAPVPVTAIDGTIYAGSKPVSA